MTDDLLGGTRIASASAEDAPMIDDLERPEAPGPETPPAPAKKRGGGPRTPEGKEQSKRNALKHGMRAKVLLPDDLAAAVAERTAELAGEFLPGSPYEEWLVGQMALASARLDRCAELAIADLRKTVDRALLCWEEDRRKAVEDLGARLAKDPARVAQALGRSRQGADWLLERWEGLGEALGTNGGWDDAQRRLAFDLLGVAPELRNGSTRVPPEADAAALAELVERQVARLRGRRERSLDALDEAERAMAAAGMPLDEDAATARIRRYEASCRRDLRGARAELLRCRNEPPAAESQGRAAEPLPARPPMSEAASIWLAKRAGTPLRP